MKLTDELQNKIGNAKSEDEVKKILGETKKNVEDAGVILDDADLDQVAGGFVINIESNQLPNYEYNTLIITRG